MLGIVNNLFSPRANPIGIDFGTETLRLAQVASGSASGEARILAAASLDVPSAARNDPQQRLAFLISALKELIPSGGFRGRQAVLGLPSSALQLLHLRLPPMDDAALRKAIPFEARGKLPYDPSHALIRHMVAGEVYHGSEQKLETILMASPKAAVEALLAAAGKAKLDIVGINTEPLAMLDCFQRLARRKEDREATVCYLDIGASGSRVIIARGSKVLFARSIPIGGDHFTRAVANQTKVSFEEAKLMRLRLAEAAQPMAGTPAESAPRGTPPPLRPMDPQPADAAIEPPADPQPAPDHSFALLGAAMAKKSGVATLDAPAGTRTTPAASPEATDPAAGLAETLAHELRVVETAVREPLGKLIEEVDMCRRYHEATFPSAPVDKLLFVGGEGRQKGLCAFVARELGLAASVGDPMARMAKATELPPESGLDRRGPQPAWAVALGLSMGPLTAQP
jgi:type IV pilus assembly protein PilM